MKTWIALLLFATLAQCPAADPLATLAELRAALREELKSALDKGNIENNQRLFLLESLLVESLPDKELPDEKIAQTLQALGQIRAITRDKKVSDLAEALVSELRTQSKEAAQRLQENFNKTLAKCIREGLRATKPGEVDAPLKELAGLKKQLNTLQYRNSESQMAFNSQGLQTTEELLNAFQDVLFAAEKGSASSSSAQRLSNGYSYRELSDIIPRSEFLEAMNAALGRLPQKERKAAALSREEIEQKVSEITEGVKKLEDLESALKQVESLNMNQQKAGGFSADGLTTMDLKNIQTNYANIAAGVTNKLDISVTIPKPRDSQLGRIRNMLIRYATPRLLGAQPAREMQENESITDYLKRNLADALEARDWGLLAKVLEFNQGLVSTLSPLSTNDSSALRQFLGAQNQERARQYGAAVASYLAALKTGSQSIPAEFIGDRLAAIEKEHPKEYQAGVDVANNPPPDRYSPFPRTVLTPTGSPASQVSTSLPTRAGPSASSSKSTTTPAPESAPQRAEPKPTTPKPTEPVPAKQ